jgi:hypothetical protein
MSKDERSDYLTDKERKLFEILESKCKDTITDATCFEVKSEVVNKTLIEIAILYSDIRHKASLEDLTVEQRAFLGEKELPFETIEFICGISAKFLL